MELKLVLALLVQRLRLAPLPNARVDRSITITMRPRGGLRMRVERQDRRFAASVVRVRGDLRGMVELPEPRR